MDRVYDVIIIGGGIYGAAMLWEASSRGLRALLLEQGDFASATSANSLKIIHGGIRSLQDLDFARTLESIEERRAMLRIAPHLVAPLPCIMPTYRRLARSRTMARLGLSLYDLMARGSNEGVDPERRIPPGRMISREEIAARLPYVRAQGLTGGACWHDAQVWNTERLVLAFVMSALAKGGHARNYMRAEELLIEGERVVGVTARDVSSGGRQRISASHVIDCRGPWQQRGLVANGGAGPEPEGHGFARAYNIVVKRRIVDFACGLDAPAGEREDGGRRLMFITPWRGGAIIGTWYDFSNVSPDAPVVEEAAIVRAVEQINKALPGLALQREEVSRVHCGLLPCNGQEAGTGEPALDKVHQIRVGRTETGADGLTQVRGVKYTGARRVAEETLAHVGRDLGRALPPSRTKETPLYGGDIDDWKTWRHGIMDRYGRLYPADLLERLMRNYGDRIAGIMAYVEQDESLGEYVPGLDDTLRAEIAYTLDQEMVRTLPDLLLRRTDIGTFERPPPAAIEYCARALAGRFGWDDARREAEISRVLSGYGAW